ncbi:MAG: pyridoxal phosphate-dependent aminotransferase [Actinomycetota bacterium]|nr:pyridoxal phosphate-dependent aminotransferase [Actinomycetota bacterium]
MADVPRISARVAAITPSATLAVDARAKELRAAGEDVIVFAAGEPDFPSPPHVVEAAVAACRDPRNHRYTPAPGLPELRQAIADKTRRDSGLEVAASQVLVTNGGKHAIYTAFATLLDSGDEVLLPAPYWTTYPEPIALFGATPVVVPTDVASGFKVSVEQLEAAVTPRTKALVFVSPSNPSGAVYAPEQVEAIGRWAAERGIWVVTDEIYEHLTYDDHRFSSMPVLVPELAERCVVVNGVAKTYAMTGWRVGWMIGPPDVVAAGAGLQSHATSNVANVSQRAALAAVSGGLDDVERMREAFDRRRLRMFELLAALPGVECLRPEGAFYAFPSFEGVLGHELGGRRIDTTLELAQVVLEEAKVAIVPGEAFDCPGHARLSFALGDDDLEEGMARLAKFLA